MNGLLRSIFVIGLAMTLSGSSESSLQKARDDSKPLTIAEVNRRKVIGELGHPLGTVVTIEGQAADETYTREKSDAGRTLLRVKSVNGKELAQEVVFPFASLETVKLTPPVVGSRFRLIGFETGEFVGMPDGVFDYVPRFATTNYYLRASFVVVSAR